MKMAYFCCKSVLGISDIPAAHTLLSIFSQVYIFHELRIAVSVLAEATLLCAVGIPPVCRCS